MTKKVIFNGIEILTDENDSSAQDMLCFVETIIDNLESDLDQADENFHLSINMDFSPEHLTKHSFSMTNLSNNGTRGKVMKILEKSSIMHEPRELGSVRIDLEVDDI
jgi:hypothetical protein